MSLFDEKKYFKKVVLKGFGAGLFSLHLNVWSNLLKVFSSLLRNCLLSLAIAFLHCVVFNSFAISFSARKIIAVVWFGLERRVV